MVQNPKRTILIVEDNPLNMKLASDLLEFGGFQVLKTTSGEGALEALKTLIPDLILLDLRLPGMSGFDVLKKIKEAQPAHSIPIVAMTAQGMREERKKIMEAGFDAYILKPFDTVNFVKQVAAVVQGEVRHTP